MAFQQYDLFENVIEDMEDVFYKSGLSATCEWYPHLDDILDAHKAYVGSLEITLRSVQKEKQQCQHLDKNPEAPLVCTRPGELYCAVHFTLYECARCKSVCKDTICKICDVCIETNKKETLGRFQ